MAKVRKQMFTLDMYLKKLKSQDVRQDQDVQRMANQWNNSMSSELIVSILNDEYVPPIILGQEGDSQMWLIDGLQRSTALILFRYGNLKISPSVEEPVIEYRAKSKDADGNIKYDGNGDICWESKSFDIRRKAYERLPEELKNKFNEYQIETVIHENYTMQQISRLVRRFNFNKGMTVAQKSLTFCDVYARKIREILKRKFFIEVPYTKAERKNGSLERVLMETVMCMFHLGDWKKAVQIGAYINENASMEEFDILENIIERLETAITEDLYSLFTNRDSFILFTLFHKFTRLNMEDGTFTGFLSYFKELTDGQDMNEFYGIDKNRSTKDKNVVIQKLDKLGTLMCEYLHINKEDLKETDILGFARENVSPDVVSDDIWLYTDMLKGFASKVDAESKLLDKQNHASLIAVIAYACRKDIQIDNWFVDYFKRNDSYISDQVENFQYMKCDLEDYMRLVDAA